jgi:hypothetical protein
LTLEALRVFSVGGRRGVWASLPQPAIASKPAATVLNVIVRIGKAPPGQFGAVVRCQPQYHTRQSLSGSRHRR